MYESKGSPHMIRIMVGRGALRGPSMIKTYLQVRTAASPSLEGVSEQLGVTFNDDISRRMNTVNDLLENKNVRFRHSVQIMANEYERINSNLVEDICANEITPTRTLEVLFRHFEESSSLRAMILCNLKDLLRNGKVELIIEFLKLINETRTAGIAVPYEDVNDLFLSDKNEVGLRDDLANIIIQLTLFNGIPLLASSFILEFQESNICIYEETFNTTISALTADKKVNFVNNSFAIMRLITLLSLKKLSLSKVIEVFNYLNLDSEVPYFANQLYELVIDNQVIFKNSSATDLGKFNKSLLHLAETNLDKGNTIRTHLIWKRIMYNSEIFQNGNLRIVRKILESLKVENKDLLEETILYAIPTELYYSDELVDFFLVYYGLHKEKYDKFNEMVRKLKPPLNRSNLSSLFRVFLEVDNQKGTQRILSSIFNSSSGVNPSDIGAVAGKLIKNDQLEQCLKTLAESNISLSKKGYINMLDYIFDKSDPNNWTSFLAALALKFRRLDPSDECIGILTHSVIRYISEKFGTRNSRRLYSKLSTSLNRELSQSDYRRPKISMAKYALPEEILPLLQFSGRTKCDSLTTILLQAIKTREFETIYWAIDELRFLGVFLKDILALIRSKDDRFYSEFVNREICSAL
ncbi:Piso0_005488 [Millerozyma farinosa CBS 7064]|uniref:Piso0_005488 protein n=1 Tax=Pichia sorbitophila (strain ATCC MYA-4447 / BCRC 22081 / CBS 7064 / NBRC 10061 / NRRL Y-12695) TaxID=559304 RepID=G8Y584_PICSO|nr:Piso0_005488 [Millerozyma farinosa CBS 7064]